MPAAGAAAPAALIIVDMPVAPAAPDEDPGAGAELLCGGPMPGTHDAGGGNSMKPPNIDIASSMLPHGSIMKFWPFKPHFPSAVQQLAISKPMISKRAHCGSESGMM